MPPSVDASGLARLNRAVEYAEAVASSLSGVALFLIMAIVFLDVFLRYLFRMPFSWSYDLISIYLVPVTFFLIISETFRRNHHVAVDILYLRFSENAKRAARLVIALLMLPVVWQIISLSTVGSIESYRKNEVISGAILWPTWIPLGIVVLGFSLLFVRLALDAAALAIAFVTRSSGVPGESPGRVLQTGHDQEIP